MIFLCFSFTAGGEGISSRKDSCSFSLEAKITVNFTKDDGEVTTDIFGILAEPFFIYLSRGEYTGNEK
jgi:hypothetical protein